MAVGVTARLEAFHFLLMRLQLAQPPLEEILFDAICSQASRLLVCCCGLPVAIQPTQEIRARGVEQVVFIERALLSEVINSFQTVLYPRAHRDGYGVVERDHRRRIQGHQLFVKRRDLLPISFRCSASLSVQSGDRGLQLIGPDRAKPESLFDQFQSLGNRGSIPE